MTLTDEEVHAKLFKPVGKPVEYKYPGGRKLRGLLKDRVIVRSDEDPSGALYWDVVDLIEFPDEAEHKEWIRIGYYRQVGDKVRWAGQTTITEPYHIMKRVFAEAAQREWFRDVLPQT